ncbi:Hpt domain-containing protein [Desulfovibrio sp. JC022]|uniref:Hpt domain-containing protein n=1 Tax=Desulfovibrio sp. JC022 TaxID=2593642 RepID=UPI0013D36AB1|nr:Hpt domain-containing protein [Desulfovibrio sp. JC022]NDV22814.1 Hpt domain-containing protein [Desulfovibrio sp. JC022]
MSDVVFNEQAFYNHLGGDRELGAEILRVYIVDAPARTEALAEALRSDDLSQAVKYSHALKGISATIRASGITLMAEKIEMASRNGDLERAREVMPKVYLELQAVLKKIQDHLEK